jgi:hypothetical protein
MMQLLWSVYAKFSMLILFTATTRIVCACVDDHEQLLLEEFMRLGIRKKSARKFSRFVEKSNVDHIKPYEWVILLTTKDWTDEFPSQYKDVTVLKRKFEKYFYSIMAEHFANFIFHSHQCLLMTLAQWLEFFIDSSSYDIFHELPLIQVPSTHYQVAFSTLHSCSAGREIASINFVGSSHSTRDVILEKNRKKNIMNQLSALLSDEVNENSMLLFNGRTYTRALQVVERPEGMAGSFPDSLHCDFNVVSCFYLGCSIQKAIDVAYTHTLGKKPLEC